MQRSHLPAFDLLPLVLTGLLLAACALPAAHASAPAPRADAGSLLTPLAAGSEVACADPAPAAAAECQALAQRILASTVRLELRVTIPGWGGRGRPPVERVIGHGTVRDGRYVVTHNHYHLVPGEYGNGRLVDVTVYRADGAVALNQLPSNAVTVIASSPETLLFDFGAYGDQGLLSMAGFSSAECGTLAANDLRPGTEVAQVDWDGHQARVEWVRVMSVVLDDTTPHLVLDHYIAQGASGGGVFYRGVHVANNWSRSQDRSADTGEVLRTYSVAALNAMEPVAIAVQ